MPELKNPRWEKFAQLRASGRTLGSSYAMAFGYEKELRQHSAHGSRLSQRPIVAQRIEEHLPQSEVASSADLDPEFVIQNLLQVLQKAVESGKFSSANKTLELLGKFQGMFQESRMRHGPPDPLDGMDSKQLIAHMKRKFKDLGPGSLKKLGLIAIEPASGQRNEVVRYFREQLQRLDPAIQVVDPHEGQVQPPESGGQQGEALH